mgnify:CR=1 FL=1
MKKEITDVETVTEKLIETKLIFVFETSIQQPNFPILS